MIRTICNTAKAALNWAAMLFLPGYKSIKWVESMPGARDAAPEPEENGGAILKRLRNGDYPDELPCFLVIDGNGEQIAACYYLKHKEYSKPIKK